MKYPLPFLGETAHDLFERKVYSVSELNRSVRGLLERQFSAIWIEGEISNFKRHTSGHMYFVLKDAEAQVPAVFFSRQNQRLDFEPKDGLKVLAWGRPSLYDVRGQYQLYVERLEPQGLGALQLALAALREKLEKEGLFAFERKRKIPAFPEVLGIITSPTGAALHDMLSILKRRFCGRRIVIHPAQVQGEGAGRDIAKAVADFNEWGGADVLIVGRGGGSLEDLWAFNEEEVVRAIALSRIPIISAVGHETDWTLADAAADLRAPTPSAAAELVAENRQTVIERVENSATLLQKTFARYVSEQKERVDLASRHSFFRSPGQWLSARQQAVDEAERFLQRDMSSFIQKKMDRLSSMSETLQALSPLSILARGFSVTFGEKGELVKSAKKLKMGQTLRTVLADGECVSRVMDILEKEEKGVND